MKKESVNTFSEGLNYDLNPITTPNNVLTENINGTFITFNGDELALQNDAGNTKILIPETTNEYVTLTRGFYPIGVKEYGGVLYIVSAKNLDRNAEDIKIGQHYYIDDVILHVGIYYRCRAEYDSDSTEIDSTKWLNIGSDHDALAAEYNKIEFGSYPSPQFAVGTKKAGILYNPEISTLTLYTPQIINNLDFKSGGYVNFGSTISEADKNLVSYQNNGTITKKVFVVKLWHQLSNGFLDLTQDVWNKYNIFKQSNPSGNYSTFWFAEPAFKYYCPNLFKGKLAMSIELENLDTFKFDGVSLLTFVVNNTQLKLTKPFTEGTPQNGWVSINGNYYHYTAWSTNILTLVLDDYADAKSGDIVSNVTLNTGGTSTKILSAGTYYEIPISEESDFNSSNTAIIGNSEVFTYDSIISETNIVNSVSVTTYKLVSNVGIVLKNDYAINTDIKPITLTSTTPIANTISSDFGSYYELTTNIKYSYSGSVGIDGATIKYFYAGNNLNLTPTVSEDKLTYKLTYKVKLSENLYQNKVITYQAIPNIKIGTTSYAEADLPTIYVNKYTLYGERLISLSLAKILFEVSNKYTCSTAEGELGKAYYHEVVLKNSDGQYVDKEGVVSAIPNLFIDKSQINNYPKSNHYNVLATYTHNTVTGLGTVVTRNEELSDNLVSMFETSVLVYKYNVLCDKFDIGVTTNVPTSLNITRNSSTKTINASSVSTSIQVTPNVNTDFYSEAYGSTWSCTFTAPTNIKLAMIETITYETICHSSTLSYDWKFTWPIKQTYVEGDFPNLVRIASNSLPSGSVELKYNPTSGKYECIVKNIKTNPTFIDVTIGSPNDLSVTNSNYDNLDTLTEYVQINGGLPFIFKKSFRLFKRREYSDLIDN